MRPNLLSMILSKINEKYHLYLRLTKQIWKIESERAVIFPNKSILLTQVKNIFINCKLIHLGKFPILKKIRHKNIFKYACRIGDKILMRLTYRYFTWDNTLYEICRGWQTELIQLAINRGANDWNLGLYGACRADPKKLDANDALIPKSVCRARDLETVELMIANGANNWYGGFLNACRGGSQRIVRLMITKLKEKYRERKECIPKRIWREGLDRACKGGNLRIINQMIRKGADNWNEGMVSACEGSSLEAVKLMIEYGADAYNAGLIGACYGGNLDIVKLMMEKGGFSYSDITPNMMRNICLNGNLELFQFMLEGIKDLHYGLDEACYGGNLEIVKILIKNGAKPDRDADTYDVDTYDNVFQLI